jgi:hypothetical protein
MLVLRHIGMERGTAVLDTLPRSGGRLQSIPGAGGMGGARASVSPAGMTPQPPDPAQVAAAVARHRACQALREFRARLYGCLTSRPDALFELCDAILCADHAVTSLAELSMVPECPPLRPRGSGKRARGGGGCGSRSTPRRIPGRMPGALPAAATSITTPAAATAPARRSRDGSTSSPRRSGTCAPRGRRSSMWSAPPRPRARIRQSGRSRTCCAACRQPAGAAPRWSSWTPATASPRETAGLAGCPVHLLIRLPAGSVFHADPVAWPGKKGRPGKHGTPVTCHNDPARANPEPDESLTLPGTPLYGTVRVRPGLAPGAPPHPRRPRLLRRLGWRAARPARHRASRHRRSPARRPHPAQDDVAVARRARARCHPTSYGAPTWPASTKNTPSGSPGDTSG